MNDLLNNEQLQAFANKKVPATEWEVSMARELLQRREAAETPVCVVEFSDYMTAAEMVGDEPRHKAVKVLFGGALVIGEKLYREPPLTGAERERLAAYDTATKV